MKIGTDFALCVRDIVTETVDQDEVLLIFIYHTEISIDNHDEWEKIWAYYSLYGMPWHGLDHDEVWSVIDSLSFYRRIHYFYPRMEPAWNSHWFELMVTPQEILRNPQLKQMWEDIELMIKLTATPDK